MYPWLQVIVSFLCNYETLNKYFSKPNSKSNTNAAKLQFWAPLQTHPPHHHLGHREPQFSWQNQCITDRCYIHNICKDCFLFPGKIASNAFQIHQIRFVLNEIIIATYIFISLHLWTLNKYFCKPYLKYDTREVKLQFLISFLTKNRLTKIYIDMARN